MTHLGLQQRPAVAPLVVVGACMMTRFPASRVFRMSLWGAVRPVLAASETSQVPCRQGRAGCMRVAAVPSIEDERKEESPPSRARRWRLAALHLLTGPSSATCSAALVRPVKAGRRVICRSHRTCGLGQSNGVVSWAHAASPGREALGRRHRRGKVWLGQGSRRARRKPEEPARPIKLRQRETRADLTRRRGLRLDGFGV